MNIPPWTLNLRKIQRKHLHRRTIPDRKTPSQSLAREARWFAPTGVWLILNDAKTSVWSRFEEQITEHCKSQHVQRSIFEQKFVVVR